VWVGAVAVLGLLGGVTASPLFGARSGADGNPEAPTPAFWPNPADVPEELRAERGKAPAAGAAAPGVFLPEPPAFPLAPAQPPGAPPLALPRIVVDPDHVEPAAFLQPAAQPDPKAGQPLPPPKPVPFGDDRVRLPRLGPPIQGATPVPTEKDLEEYRQFIDGVVDPRNTLDLIEGRARVILLKATPTRTQIVDQQIADFRLLEPQGRQMTIVGRRPGTTVLNLWFTDPKDKDKEKILSYLIRVLPDPEAKQRRAATYAALGMEINKAFPQSRVRLTIVGGAVILSGQAHDVSDAAKIMRVAK
jgi:pilus assembly protein CpaC